MAEVIPARIIDHLAATHNDVSDEELLARITSLPPLADETDPRWESEDYWNSAGFAFLAMADAAATRRLRPAVRLLLERACYGDPHDLMQGLRHSCQAIFRPDWKSLADEYIALARADRLWTRYWAIYGLMTLDDPRAIPVFEASVREDPEGIRWFAKAGLTRLLHPEEMEREVTLQRAEEARARKERLDRQAETDARITDYRCVACGKPMPTYRRTCKHCAAEATPGCNPVKRPGSDSDR